MPEPRCVGEDGEYYYFTVPSDSGKEPYDVLVTHSGPWKGHVGCSCPDGTMRKAKDHPTLLEGGCKHIAKLCNWVEELLK
jgi:hypothetical protein